MTFNLNLYGDSPAELRALINALADLPGGLTIEHTPAPRTLHSPRARLWRSRTSPRPGTRQAQKGRTEARSSPCGGTGKP